MDFIGIRHNNEIYDIQSAEELNIDGDKILFDDSEDALSIIRHSCAHLMAQAIKELYPDAQFFVGPVVKEGFYYDFRTSQKIGEEDLEKIEKKMKELSKKGSPITKVTLPRDEVEARFSNDDLKKVVISNIISDTLSIYSQGDFEDLCRGPHLPHTKLLNNFKLTKISGAFLGGKEGNEMLTRIYGIAFATKEALVDYITRIEEAKKRDHRKLGQELGLFTFEDDIGGGLPLWLPNGARLRGKLEKILYKTMRKRGYEPVRGPEILKAEAWKISGHYYNYKENMYFTQIDDDEKGDEIPSSEYGIKPMNCLGHIKIFQNSLKSYRDLPIKYFEFGVVHRHEKSGVLHGHTYHIDEGGGAFYGPKIDFKITDAIGRKWQCGTIQIDLNLPERFELEYIDEKNQRVRPIMIHRAAFGSFERFIAILTEHCAGEFPFFIAPMQVIFIPINESHIAYAKELANTLIDMDIDCEIYDRNDSLNKRIRNAEKQKVPLIVVLGDKEVENRTTALRDRRNKEQKELSEEEFLNLIKENMSEVAF